MSTPASTAPGCGSRRERGRAGEIYNVCDDDPAPLREWLPALAQSLGARPPRHLPAWFARIAASPAAVMMMTEARGASNAKAKAELGWTPAWPSWRDGFGALASARMAVAA
jgi:nucleoside-diphosphate-sugar epimerase